MNVEFAPTAAKGDAIRLAADGARSGKYDAILAAGGDGTINEVASGILSAGDDPRRPTLGILPIGTSNILAGELGLPLNDLDAACDVVRAGKTRAIDAARAGDRYFVLMAGFGIDAVALDFVWSDFKSLMGASAYVLPAIRALAEYHPTLVTMTMDDQTLVRETFLVIVANVASYGHGDIKIAPFASLDDGWLDICVFERAPNHTVGFVGQLMMMLARRHLRDPRVRYFRAKHIRIESEPAISAQYDGDVAGKTPVEIDVIPAALDVFAP
jgi:YegS/Rv2252/BmrU family lipid kinase